MKKGIFASIFGVLLALVLATPAFAGTMNSSEQAVYDRFCQVVQDKVGILLEQDRADSFKDWAEKALVHDEIDLDQAACDELDDMIDQVLAYIEENGIDTKAEASAAYPEIAKLINTVSEKYGITVVVNASLKDGELLVNGKPIGTTGDLVNNTGFGLGRTVVVAGTAVAVLCGAYVVARKNRLFA